MATARGKKKREDFIAAVVRLIARKGIEKATTREIASEAETSLASLHYCFESKDALLLASYEYLMNTLQEVSLHVRPGAGLGHAAATLLRQMMGWYRTQPGYSQTQLEIECWVFRLAPDLCRQHYDRWLENLEGQLRTGMRPDDDERLVPTLARLITATIDGILANSFIYRQKHEYYQTTIDAAAESFELLAAQHTIGVKRGHAVRGLSVSKKIAKG